MSASPGKRERGGRGREREKEREREREMDRKIDVQVVEPPAGGGLIHESAPKRSGKSPNLLKKFSLRAKVGLGTTLLVVVVAVAVLCSVDLKPGSNKASADSNVNIKEEYQVRSVNTTTCDTTVRFAKFFNVSKVPDTDATVVLNTYNKKAYVLAPEDSKEIPSKDLSDAFIPSGYETSYLTTPLKGISVTETQIIRYIELLGERDAISSFSPYATSPCLAKMKEEGLASDYDQNDVNQTNPTFVGYLSQAAFPMTIQAAVSAEQINGSMLATSEWIKFFAPFFGRECEAVELFDEISKRYDCHETKVKQFSEGFDPLKVVVASKNFGYDCGGCEWQTDPYFGISDAGYWKDYIKAASATPLVETSVFDNLAADGSSGYKFTNATEFQNLLKSADIVIDSTYLPNATAESILDAYNITKEDEPMYKFIENRALWRHDRRVAPDGGDDWFEGRYPEADVLLEDIIFALHPKYSGLILNPKHSLTWLRNMYSSPQQDILSAESCANVDAPAPLIADSCKSISLN